MATITIAVSGSAISGANNSKPFNISDSDLQILLNWVKAFFNLPGNATNAQIELAYANWIRDLTVQSIQSSNTVTTVPPQISMA